MGEEEPCGSFGKEVPLLGGGQDWATLLWVPGQEKRKIEVGAACKMNSCVSRYLTRLGGPRAGGQTDGLG